jgi:long-chain fatty acid transport protein
MSTTARSWPIQVLVLAGVLICSTAARAGGFQITEICAACQGVRNAGLAAAGVDSSAAMYFNPATLARLPGGDGNVNLHIILPRFQFSDDGSTNAFGDSPPPYSNFAGPAIGDHHDDAGETAVFPTAFYGQRIDDRWAVGIGFNVPYGLVTEYGDDWVGRYNAVKSELQTYNINPAVAFRFNEQISFGVGFNALYASAELTNALDYGTLAFLQSGGRLGSPSTPALDGFQKLTGDDWGYGWNAGILFELNPATRFGIAYRSKIDTTLDGRVKIRGNTNLPGVLGETSKINAKADYTAAATLNIGAYHALNERLALMAGATWTQWSDFDELRVKLEDGRQSVQPENWDDVWRISLGAAYLLNDQWTLRGGLEYDPTPVQKKYRTPRIPDEDRYWFVVGAGFQASRNLSFDFAYTYLFTPEYDIDDQEVTTGALAEAANPSAAALDLGNTLKGSYEADSHIISMQATWKF